MNAKRVNDEEMAVLKNASKLYSGKITSMMEKPVFEKLEDDHDLHVAEEYLKEKKDGMLKTKPAEDICKALGIDWNAL